MSVYEMRNQRACYLGIHVRQCSHCGRTGEQNDEAVCNTEREDARKTNIKVV